MHTRAESGVNEYSVVTEKDLAQMTWEQILELVSIYWLSNQKNKVILAEIQKNEKQHALEE